MSKYLLSTLIFLVLVSCMNQNQSGEAMVDSDSENQEVLQGELARLLETKVLTDTLISQNKLQLEILVQQPDSEKLMVVVNEEFPEEVERTFNIWRDSEDRIVFIGEYPHSRSGDWYIEYKHYFNEAGETFAFERITNFFNSMCADAVAYEVITDFYNSEFSKLYQIYALTDLEGETLNKEECVFHYDYPYEISRSLESCLRKINHQMK